MSKICSVCFKQSPMNLTPLFYNNNGDWENTCLSDMIEHIFEKKINRECQSELFVCHYCIRELSQVFYNYPVEPQENIDYFFERPAIELPAESWMIRLDDVEPIIPERGINCLEDKSLRKILKYIPINKRRNLETVCTRWKHIMEDSYTDLRSVRLINPSREVFLKLSTIRCSHLVNLSISNIDLESIEYLKAIGTFCSSLTCISFPIPHDMNCTHLTDVFSTMRNLNEVKFYFPSILSPIKLQLLFNSLHSRLTKIHFIRNVSNDDMNHLYLYRAVHQNLFFTRLFSDFDIALKKFTGLTDILFKNFPISDAMMTTLTQMEKLYTISIMYARELSETAEIMEDLPNICRFIITHSKNIEVLFRSLLKHCIHLRLLSITESMIHYYKQIPQTVIDAFFKPNDVLVNCREFLKVLEINRCGGNVDLITEIIPQLINLKILRLTDIPLTDKILLDMSVNCPSIMTLNLAGCVNLTGQAFMEISRLKELTHLNLGRIHFEEKRYVDESILNILTNCLQLRQLTLFPSDHIASSTLENICQLKNLTLLNARSCNGLTDHVLMDIVRNCKKLDTIGCRDCTSITNESIAFVVEECLLLKSLDITNSGATIECVIDIQKKIISRKNNIVLDLKVAENWIKFISIVGKETRLLNISFCT